MSSRSFEVLALSPCGLSHPGIAVAAARAGGVGLLDVEFCDSAAAAQAQFRCLLAATQAAVGLQASDEQLALVESLVALAGDRSLTLVIAVRGAVPPGLAALGAGGRHRLLVELSAASQLAALPSSVDGLVAKGHEAPGWMGEDSSYILLQKLLRATTLPVYVRGGVGLHTAAGCRAAGAAGVVLDDQLLLLDESALADVAKTELARLSGAETRLFGELLDAPCRIYARPLSPALKQADADNRAAEAGAMAPDAWRSAQSARIGWSESALMPVGQGIGAGALYARRYKRVGKLVQALRKTSFDQVRDAARLGHLSEDSPLARSHGTRYPLAQGPMTRVSDNAAFAAAVTQAGALPFLALALMRGDAVLEMLRETQRLAGDRAWGVGMLGFIPQALRDEQCEAIWQCKPAYALIAGGRPDQAAAFEQRGIKTYIHAPAPALLRMYLEQGARRFVFEGRECGGHIGPITSFPLWEQMIEVLLDNVKPGSEAEVHLLFAGGISDARSGAILAAMTAPLAARGMKVGALMGTAYLFTSEIVSTGAIVQTFQDQALVCARTVNVETGPGHSTRCADTRFAQDFHDARRALLRDNRSGDEIRDALEELNLGRLRVASKGRDRDASGQIVEVPVEQQIASGMYMIGQVATLTDSATTVAELHRRVCVDSQTLLLDADFEVQSKVDGAKPSDIAIIGIGALLPKAQNVQAYWDNILNQVDAITEIPASRWDWRLYFDADRNARDKVYSKWGGFMDEVLFDPIRYGIPPKSMKSIDPLQLLTLETVARALEDAGLEDFDRERTSVILGASGGAGDLGVQYAVRSELPRFGADIDPSFYDRLPEWSNESFAGVLLNVASGRVANRMDFGGLNFTIDAACASSLAALSMAVSELESGRSNVAIAGGVDTVQSPYGFMSFSKTHALSPQGKARAFDKNADGIVISEGVTMVVLKRLADAEAAGDRIYAVIKAVAGSSDGRAMGMTAPRPDGQIRALDRAYHKAGFTPDTLGMLEAHGTGTPVGDKAEAETVSRVLQQHGAAAKTVALGSVKNLLGHTKACAGMAGLVKLAMAMHHRVLPAHAGVEDPLDAIADAASPAYLLKKPRPWLANPDGLPRRGAVSAFGFGGTNFHAVVEEYRDGYSQRDSAGSANWMQELIVVRAADAAVLATQVERLLAALRPGSSINLADLAYTLARAADEQRGARACLAFATRDLKTLVADLEAAARVLGGGARPLPPHIKLKLDVPTDAPKLAFIFPGQGAQHLNMGAEAALFVEELRAGVERADRVLHGLLPDRLSRRMWPEAAFDESAEAEQSKRLTDTRFAQPAIGALEIGYLNLARRLGVEAVATAGHSYGEFAALHAAGVFDEDSFLKLSAVRGRVMNEAANAGTPGGMAAVQAPREQVAAVIAKIAGVKIANHNAPRQAVISGPAVGVDLAVDALSAANLRCIRLPVSGAFHTELMAGAQAPLSHAIAQTVFAQPRLCVYSNGSGARYPQGVDAMRAQLDAHLLSSVEFVAEIESMVADGVRVFLELGPKSICSGMIADTLAGRDARSLSLDGQGGGLRGLLTGLADLLTLGVPMDIGRLFDGRSPRALPLSRLAELAKPLPVAATAWYLTGGYARAVNDPKPCNGVELPLTLETSTAAKQAIVQKIIDAAPRPAPVAALAPAAPSLASGAALSAYHETMRQFLALQERVILQYLGAPGATPPAAAPLPIALPVLMTPMAAAAPLSLPLPSVVAAVASMTVVGTADLSATLLRLVAERTGYPQDMLSLDADLEADLGIDSIKRVEIIGALEKAIAPSLAAAMRASMERYTRAKTLRAILDPLALLADSQAAIPVAAMVIAATATATAASFDARALLLGIVAERTGYPAEMLALDADLEADLGIDSIKRVEIIGAFEKQMPSALAASMRASMESFTRAKTLSGILQRLAALAPAAAPEPVAIATTAEVIVDHRALLLNIVAERTGYPVEMLALDADLEADLGIDSIKRVEIVGALEKQLPAALAASMQASMETFTRAKSLAAILARLAALAPSTSAAAAPGPALAAIVKPIEAGAEAAVPRYVIRPRAAPLPAGRVSLTGTVIVAGGAERIVDPLLARLIELGVTPLRIAAVDDAAIQSAVLAARSAGPIAGLIHLHGLAEDQPDTLPAWRDLGDRTVVSLFRLIKHLGADIATARVIAATRLGGTFGRDAVGPGTPVAGGVVGLLNCVRQEYPEATLRAVDFNGQTDATIASHLLDELIAIDRAPEAGHTGDARYSVATAFEALADTPFAPHLQPAADWVVMATGGARGITAELLEEMVVPGIRLMLLGRTAEPGPEDAVIAAAADSASLKKLLLSQARARGEAPKPVDIDRAVSRVLTDREIRGNLARLRARGALVEYQACDVRDPLSFGAVIDGLYERHGRIDAVLHGAGVIEDRRIADKTEESFARVFGTKLDSSFILTQKLRPDRLRLLVFFTSVAGRYGNSGQIDYAAANESINRLAWTLSRRWTETRVIAANWGPWDAGMASDAVKQKLRERGMEPIPVTSGRQYFLRELACGPKHEVELVIGKGPWGDVDDRDRNSRIDEPASRHPLIRAPLRMGAGGSLLLSHCFTAQSDPYLADQVIDGRPLLAASVAAEWIGQVVAQGWPGWQVAEIQDLRRLGEPRMEINRNRDVEFRARASSHSGPGEQMVVVDIGEPGRKSAIYRASVRLVDRLTPSPLAIPGALAIAPGAVSPSVAQAYERWLFQRGRFRNIRQLLAVRADGIDALVQPSLPTEWVGGVGDWLFDPALIDAATQLASIWSGVHRNTPSQPCHVARILRFPGPLPSAALTMRLRVRADAADGELLCDATVIDANGQLRLALLGAHSAPGLDFRPADSGQA